MTIKTRISGAICGNTWMPQTLAGFPISFDLQSRRRRFSDGHGTVRECLESWLCENGGDFQDAEFTADTEIIIEYRTPTPTGYQYHVRTRTLADCPSVADLVNQDVYAGDFFDD